MNEVYVVYFSSTGNTEAMAEAVAAGIEEAGGKAHISSAEGFSAEKLKDVPAFALGCPACGDEDLDQSIEDLMDELAGSLEGKKVGLFGSYGWGDGDWMREWEKRVAGLGAKVVGGEGIIVNDAPGDDVISQCKAMGAELAG